MGGETRLIARLPDGKVYSNIVYTSSISSFVCNVKSPHLDLFHVRKYLCNEYLSNDRAVAPNGYGLTAVDHVTKKIFDLQGYTFPLSIDGTGLSLSLTGGVRTGDEEFLEHVRFKDLFEHGFITQRRNRRTNVLEDITSLTCEEIFEEEIKNSEVVDFMDIKMNDYPVDYGYDYVTFDEDPEGFIQMFDAMKAAGFEFTDADIHGWKEFYQEEDLDDIYYGDESPIPKKVMEFYLDK